MNKYEFTINLIRDCGLQFDSVLDVGCRDGILKRHLGAKGYFGIDIDRTSACDAIVDIGEGAPFRDNQFDLLVALDVAEHIDNIYAAVSEMLRVSRNAVIALPNMYHFGMRCRFLLGRPLSDKYILNRKNAEAGGYRHRWLFTAGEAISFMQDFAHEQDLRLTVHNYYAPGLIGTAARMFSSVNLGAEALFFVFRK